MAKSRAEREAEFKSRHGVSSGTYYTMRRQATARGVDTAIFDKLARDGGYVEAKTLTSIAKTEPDIAQGIAGLVDGNLKLPGSPGSNMRKGAFAKLAAIWRKAGGRVSKLLGAMGSPKRKGRVANSLR